MPAPIWYNHPSSTMIHPIVFVILSGLITAGALGVTLARDPVYAVLSLVVSLFGLSALFVCLGAYFLAVVQVLVDPRTLTFVHRTEGYQSSFPELEALVAKNSH